MVRRQFCSVMEIVWEQFLIETDFVRPDITLQNDDQLILSSEVGVMDIAPEKIIVKERLRPGKMLLVDTVQGRVIGDEELKEMYADRQPYGEWLDSNLIELKNLKIPNQLVPTYKPEDLKRLQKAFGYSYEEVETSIKNMALNGGEGTAAWVLIYHLRYFRISIRTCSIF